MTRKLVKILSCLFLSFSAIEGHTAAQAEATLDNLQFRVTDLTPDDGHEAGWIPQESKYSTTSAGLYFSNPWGSQNSHTDLPGFLRDLDSQTLQNNLGMATADASPTRFYASVEGLGRSLWSASAISAIAFSGGPGRLGMGIELLPYSTLHISGRFTTTISEDGSTTSAGETNSVYASTRLSFYGDYADTEELSASNTPGTLLPPVTNTRLFDISMVNDSSSSKQIYLILDTWAYVKSVPEPQSIALCVAGLLTYGAYRRKMSATSS